MLGEAAHHSGHVLPCGPSARPARPPARIGRRRRPGLEHVDAPVDAARSSVAAGKGDGGQRLKAHAELGRRDFLCRGGVLA